MKQSVDVRVRSVFIIKQRHGLSCNKRLCSPLLETQRVKGGQRSEVRSGAGGSHLGNSAHCRDDCLIISSAQITPVFSWWLQTPVWRFVLQLNGEKCDSAYSIQWPWILRRNLTGLFKQSIKSVNWRMLHLLFCCFPLQFLNLVFFKLRKYSCRSNFLVWIQGPPFNS